MLRVARPILLANLEQRDISIGRERVAQQRTGEAGADDDDRASLHRWSTGSFAGVGCEVAQERASRKKEKLDVTTAPTSLILMKRSNPSCEK